MPQYAVIIEKDAAWPIYIFYIDPHYRREQIYQNNRTGPASVYRRRNIDERERPAQSIDLYLLTIAKNFKKRLPNPIWNVEQSISLGDRSGVYWTL